MFLLISNACNLSPLHNYYKRGFWKPFNLHKFQVYTIQTFRRFSNRLPTSTIVYLLTYRKKKPHRCIMINATVWLSCAKEVIWLFFIEQFVYISLDIVKNGIIILPMKSICLLGIGMISFVGQRRFFDRKFGNIIYWQAGKRQRLTQ